MSPTTIFLSAASMPGTCTAVTGAGGVYPGYGMDGWGWEGYTGTQTQPSQDPYLAIFSLEGPTHGQMKAKYEVSMRFLR